MLNECHVAQLTQSISQILEARRGRDQEEKGLVAVLEMTGFIITWILLSKKKQN